MSLGATGCINYCLDTSRANHAARYCTDTNEHC